MHRCVACVCVQQVWSKAWRYQFTLYCSEYCTVLVVAFCDLQNLVEYHHHVNLSTTPPHVASPVVVLVCAELLVKQGVTIFCVAWLPRRGSLVEVLSIVEGLSGHGPRAVRS